MDPATHKPALPASQFYMWRCLLSLSWVDGVCGQEETDYFAKVFDTLPRYFDLTQEQRDGLAGDLVAAKDITPLLAHINDPDAIDTLIIFGRDLALLDGEMHPNENAILEKLKLRTGSVFDSPEMRRHLKDIVDDLDRQSDTEKSALRQSAHGRNPLFAALDKVLLKLGIDVIK